MKNLNWLILGLLTFACQTAPQQEAEEATWPLTTVSSPASGQSGEPNLVVSAEGELYLSWIDALEGEQHALRFASWEGESWSAPQTIAQDSNWFVNWADFPSLAVQDDWMAAHWLAKSAEGTYDYNVMVSTSQDEGRNWSAPFVLHRDGIPAEHGFVTMLATADEEIFAVWLDGRNTKNESEIESHDHSHGGGAMTLHATAFDKSGKMKEETMLDGRICDCCQTDAVRTAEGLLVVYRDRSENEVRDIFFTRELDGQWTEPQAVHTDNWKISGCPVNGPAVAAQGSQVAVAWFTAADDTPKVQLVFSENSGAEFKSPVRLDHGNPLGRVDVILLNKGNALVSWMEGTEEGAVIKAALVEINGEVLQDKIVANIASLRSSGFPIMEKAGDRIFFAWTEVEEESAQVKTAYLRTNDLTPLQ